LLFIEYEKYSIFKERSWRISQQRIPHGLSIGSYQVIFESMIFNAGSKYPIIALDDIYIRDRACLDAGDCDFENG